MRSAERKTEDAVKLFLSRNDVNPETRDNCGRTPLSHAAEEGSEAVVKFLLSRNDVDPDSKDNNGRTPLSWTAWSDNEITRLFLGMILIQTQKTIRVEHLFLMR
jgi:ankyrin repeat protein